MLLLGLLRPRSLDFVKVNSPAHCSRPSIFARLTKLLLTPHMPLQRAIKRRTLRRVRANRRARDHHNVYVVLLDKAVGKIRSVCAANPNRNPKKPCVYVGMTGLKPQERFANHQQGIKSASL